MWRPVMCPPKAEKAPPSSELTCTGSLAGTMPDCTAALSVTTLLNGFGGVRNLLRCARQRRNGNHDETTEYTGGADNYLAPTGRLGLRWPIFLTLNHSPAYCSLMHRFLHDLDFSC